MEREGVQLTTIKLAVDTGKSEMAKQIMTIKTPPSLLHAIKITSAQSRSMAMAREDGLFDIEAELKDTKAYSFSPTRAWRDQKRRSAPSYACQSDCL